MKNSNFLTLIVLLLVISLVGCTAGPAGQTALPSETTPAPVLPDPQVSTTQTPPALPAAQKYLDAWKSGDFEAMYAGLTSASQQNIAKDVFSAKLENVSQETALKEMSYEILGAGTPG